MARQYDDLTDQEQLRLNEEDRNRRKELNSEKVLTGSIDDLAVELKDNQSDTFDSDQIAPIINNDLGVNLPDPESDDKKDPTINVVIPESANKKEIERLESLHKQTDDSIQSTKSLETTIRMLSEQNRNETNNKTGEEQSFTSNLLSIREYTNTVSETMSNETNNLFSELQDINTNSRKQTKAEQKDNLKQINVLKELSKNVTNTEQREQLQSFISSTETSIKKNTDMFSVLSSRAINNMGDITSVVAGLFDSPLLSVGAAYFGGKAKELFTERREQKFAIQEGQEEQLMERQQEVQSLVKEQQKIISEIEKRKDKSDESSQSKNDTSTESKVNETNQESSVSLTEHTVLLEEANYSLIEIDESIKQHENKVSEILNERNLDDISTTKNDDNVNFESTESEKNTSELNNIVDELSQMKTERSEIYNEIVQLNSEKLSSEMSEFSVSQLVGLLEEINYSMISIGDNIGDQNLSNLLEEANYSLINISDSLGGDSNTIQSNNETNTFNEDSSNNIISELIQINDKLSPLVHGREEKAREQEIFNQQLLDAIQTNPMNMEKDDKGKSGKFSVGNILGNLKGGLTGMISGFLSGMTSQLAGLFGTTLKSVIPKLFTRIFAPIMIVTSLFNGITDAIDIYNETDDLKKAAFGFFDGIIEVITFGFFGEGTLQSISDYLNGLTGPFIELFKKPFKYLYNKIEGIFDMDGTWMDKLGASIIQLNPITLITESIIGIYEELNKAIKDSFDFDVSGFVGEQFDSAVNALPSFDEMFNFSGEPELQLEPAQIMDISGNAEPITNYQSTSTDSNTNISNIHNSQLQAIREEAEKVSDNNQNMGGLNQTNVSNVNNDTRVMMPRATVRNHDVLSDIRGRNRY